MGIEVLHSLHVSFDGISRLYICAATITVFIAGFMYFLFYSCFALLFFFDLHTSCMHLFIFNKFQLPIKNKNKTTTATGGDKRPQLPLPFQMAPPLLTVPPPSPQIITIKKTLYICHPFQK